MITRVKKNRKHRGDKTGYGSKKKHRGAGSRGGRGNAGLHKHKWSWTVNNDPGHYHKAPMKSRQTDILTLNLTQVNEMALKQKITELDLSEYKVLGTGSLTQKLTIKAYSFSARALEKVKKAGGKADALQVAEESAPKATPKSKTAAKETQVPKERSEAAKAPKAKENPTSDKPPKAIPKSKDKTA